MAGKVCSFSVMAEIVIVVEISRSYHMQLLAHLQGALLVLSCPEHCTQ